MTTHNDAPNKQTPGSPPLRRFRIEKLEERIAPRHQFDHNPGNKPGGWGGNCHPNHGCSV